MTALAIEFFSRYLRRVPSSSAVLERSEYARRDRDIVWYLLRDSIWESWTRYVLVSPSTLCPSDSVLVLDQRWKGSLNEQLVPRYLAFSVRSSRIGYPSSTNTIIVS
jgi:hypothetical protein